MQVVWGMWHLHKFAGRSSCSPGKAKAKAKAIRNGMQKEGGGRGSAGLLCQLQMISGTHSGTRTAQFSSFSLAAQHSVAETQWLRSGTLSLVLARPPRPSLLLLFFPHFILVLIF